MPCTATQRNCNAIICCNIASSRLQGNRQSQQRRTFVSPSWKPKRSKNPTSSSISAPSLWKRTSQWSTLALLRSSYKPSLEPTQLCRRGATSKTTSTSSTHTNGETTLSHLGSKHMGDLPNRLWTSLPNSRATRRTTSDTRSPT